MALERALEAALNSQMAIGPASACANQTPRARPAAHQSGQPAQEQPRTGRPAQPAGSPSARGENDPLLQTLRNGA